MLHTTPLFMLAGLLPFISSTLAATAVNWQSIKTSRGDKLPDFSFCGYHGSDKSLPSESSTPLVRVSASSGDQTSDIQEALDKVEAAGGGVVELGAGTFKVSVGLTLASGTILRGSGIESTQLTVSKLKVDVPLFTLGNGTSQSVKPSLISRITDTYVGIGATTVKVENATGFEAGQTVFVSRAATAEWVRANGMPIWYGTGRNKLGFSKYMDSYVAVYTAPATSNEMGIENLSVTLNPTCSGYVFDVTDPCNAAGIWMTPWTVDSFVRNVNMTGFNNAIDVQHNASRITIDTVAFFRDRDTDRPGGYPTDINISGSQVLVRDSGQYGLATAKAFAVITQARVPGPNAVLRHTIQSSLQELYPHQRWAHGLLVEDTDASVLFIDRQTAGSGQGWTMNAGVAWNTRGPINVQSPPLGVNWAIGSSGTVDATANGTMLKTGKSVTPRSLFAAQLHERRNTAT
ncbi:hypothetical protein G7Z17_g1045 [Cylindrodendrum hubeiense]|uniref:Pectate lyase superfamily protein domain-containing protein n=1 Tax=Cylindrodendrum hubeiense TaxID=595255 RepID=A0A9P5HMA6_9HYPO|nr:hypothetical protein G7Z17_g1045 [Cylindrodendrum hubeiense]